MPRGFWGATGLLISTTIGAGIFALPYVTSVAGWPAVAFHLVALSALLIFVHRELAEVAARDGAHHRLAGFASRYLGSTAAHVAHVAIVGGILFTLVAYLILASRFVGVIAPTFSPAKAATLFWLLGGLPLFFPLRRMVRTELLGSAVKGAIILITFFSADRIFGGLSAFSDVRVDTALTPFGPVLFALAAWTAVSSMVEYASGERGRTVVPKAAITAGTALSAALYACFILGILGSSAAVTPDTLSGLSDWPAAKQILLAALGLFAIWTAYIAMADELRDSLSRDFGLRESFATAIVLAVPPIFIALGVKSFLLAVGLAGGVFLSMQYVTIALVARRALAPSGVRRFLLGLTIIVFTSAAVYEVWHAFSSAGPQRMGSVSSPSEQVITPTHLPFVVGADDVATCQARGGRWEAFENIGISGCVPPSGKDISFRGFALDGKSYYVTEGFYEAHGYSEEDLLKEARDRGYGLYRVDIASGERVLVVPYPEDRNLFFIESADGVDQHSCPKERGWYVEHDILESARGYVLRVRQLPENLPDFLTERERAPLPVVRVVTLSDVMGILKSLRFSPGCDAVTYEISGLRADGEGWKGAWDLQKDTNVLERVR